MELPPVLSTPSASDVYHRLFDHRAAIQGEINYFLDIVEEKDDGLVRMKSMRNTLNNLDKNVFPSLMNSLELHMKSLNDSSKIVGLTNDVDHLMTEVDKIDYEKISNIENVKSESRMLLFEKEIAVKKENIDEEYNKELEKCKSYYDQQEKILKMSA
ncbi:hypothetical protein HELRODRAFT_162130 [Helobdella robusta]|uniref:Biogenesis of lysosome-related organelles complex 1 subunit 5 n=1 Tax=Helobdella robusta TaxID=6412 RepID=T1ES96_HELRO|nr:hypothetical protein HELRODRAFT_162130 [Helobdella robusta]ESN98678.1 hypothetical protein HELRODRAFT_162130 [Helobdella robusta]